MTASPLDHPLPTPGDAAPEAQLAADVATLRAQFPETRALYREVCALLFFRYGITPTANKLYGLVRKGSMGTPTEVLAQFWQDLRGKMRVTIDQPGLPDALKAIAADAVQSIWQAANEAASAELAALRAEARLQASEAEAQRDQARAAVVVAEQETAAVQAERDAIQRARAALQGELDAERQAHAAAQARHDESKRQVEALERQLGEMHTQFSADLERTREQVVVAQERASATERRALREIDQERTLRQKAAQALADLRTELAAVQTRAQDAAVAAAEARVRLQAEYDTLSRQLAAAEQALERAQMAQDGLRAELEAALRRAERAQAEATASRRQATTRRQVPATKTKLKFKAGPA
ncbi:DNA-binding protein [Cupriavidus basilensis]|uniref:DNA-binding protein n=1 Tax=Cupriavidus basilensis TaxID=68895 RepID=UPI00283E6E7E|nr:DNA-binding protein [Cupriavidus basilensis]MDR3383240.1 DNA-binding protein [Cupriavidus basilensis]